MEAAIGAHVGRRDEHEAVIDGALQLLRSHLGLDVALVSRFDGGDRILRNVQVTEIDLREGAEPAIGIGDRDTRERSLCHHVVTGAIPEFVLDAANHPVAGELEATHRHGIGTHLGVPLVLSDGRVYGTFCGFSHRVLAHLGEGDLGLVHRLAEMVVTQVEQVEHDRHHAHTRRDRLTALVPGRDLLLARQAIVTLGDRELVGFEMLARFPTLGRPPQHVFAEAWRLGVGIEVELAACRRAVEGLPAVPAGRYLAVNVSPGTLLDPRFPDAIAAADPGRLVVELTEHARVDDYPALQGAVRRLGADGTRLAIDDVGTGFSGLDHILRLEPQVLKIDGALVRDLDTRRSARAMVAALVGYAREVDATLVAEQIESDAELAVLQELGITCGQGYLLGRPEVELTTSAGATAPG